MITCKEEKVVCAMSGGIDSSVSAALLKEADFNVIGVHMKLWVEKESEEAEKRARKVAKILKIPFYVLDFRKEFKEKVVDCFLKDYERGVTPNPCVICNKEIKFGVLFRKAKELGANFIATGHYARIKEGKEGIKLIRGSDEGKDQSYFLWRLNQKQLQSVLFPVGGYTKEDVRKMAKKFKLFPCFDIAESQEICFIRTTTGEFLEKYIKTKSGDIVDTKGKIVGEHQGLWFYTIGQRRGIKLPGGPFYVLDKDLKKNLLIVSRNEKDLYKKEVVLKNINWISGVSPKLPIKVKAKIRYSHKAAEAVLRLKNKRYILMFKKGQRAVTPGQSAVFYKGTEVLGGGIIC